MILPAPPDPFVLIDDARPDAGKRAILYRNPVAIVEARGLDDVVPALNRVRQAQSQGLHAAGYLAYEAGFALEERLRPLAVRQTGGGGGGPLLWFGLFPRAEPVGAGLLEPREHGGPDIAREGPVPLIGRQEYDRAFEQVRRAIVAGDIYQANCTFPCSVKVGDDPLAFYRAVRSRGAAGHGALVHTGEHWLLSFSPELFFALEGRKLTTRPMKGTTRRGADGVSDAALAEALRTDAKQRAENLMIVDLLRNDLSRISEPGSVRVPDLFRVETYPTVHQMVSVVTGQLARGLDAIDALRALFPCGSVTGAPKIRAMEILQDVETYGRGPYTGSIGVIGADGDASFNVAIRTIYVKKGDDVGVIGLGSGLVADSVVADEWHECLDKGRFLSFPGGGYAA